MLGSVKGAYVGAVLSWVYVGDSVKVCLCGGQC